jgi:hypothetical protein
LWRIDPLLGKELETNKAITAAAMQRRGKHAFRTEILLEMMFSTRSVQRCYKEQNWGNSISLEFSSAREAEKRWHYGSVDKLWSVNQRTTA